MSSTQTDKAVARAKRLVGVYERRKITGNTLKCEIAGFATAETVNDIMDALTPEAQSLFKQWIPSLPDDDYKGLVFWPLPPGVTPAFKKWLQDQERNGQAAQERGA
jgi:hypothetical protein